MRLCIFTFTIISSLPYLYTFWHTIPTSFYIFNVCSSSLVPRPLPDFILQLCMVKFLSFIACSAAGLADFSGGAWRSRPRRRVWYGCGYSMHTLRSHTAFWFPDWHHHGVDGKRRGEWGDLRLSSTRGGGGGNPGRARVGHAGE